MTSFDLLYISFFIPWFLRVEIHDSTEDIHQQTKYKEKLDFVFLLLLHVQKEISTMTSLMDQVTH